MHLFLLSKTYAVPSQAKPCFKATPAGDHAEALQAGTTQPDAKAPEAEEADVNGEEPVALHVATLSRYEKEKVRRIVCPKQNTGRLEVPDDVHQLWNTPQGKEKLFSLWCKSGGVKAYWSHKTIFGMSNTYGDQFKCHIYSICNIDLYYIIATWLSIKIHVARFDSHSGAVHFSSPGPMLKISTGAHLL